MRRAFHRLTATALTFVVLAIPVVVIVAFWGNGGWSQDSAPAWWWILASLCAIVGIANSWIGRRELSGSEPPSMGEDAPAALRAWWLFGETLLYMLWVGLAVALIVRGSTLGRIIGAALLLAGVAVAARLARRRLSN
jgi:Ca2+/H+ antiporter